MQLVWLLSNGQNILAHRTGARQQCKLRLKVVEDALLKDDLVKQKLDEQTRQQWQKLKNRVAGGSTIVLGLALIRGGQYVNSCNQVWGLEERSLMKAFQYRSLFFFEVLSVVSVDFSQACLEDCIVQHFHRSGLADQRHVIFQVRCTVPGNKTWWELPSCQGPTLAAAAARTFPSCHLDGDATVDTGVLVWPHLIAPLVLSGAWSKLPFLETAKAELTHEMCGSRAVQRQTSVLGEYNKMMSLFPHGRKPTHQTFVLDLLQQSKTDSAVPGTLQPTLPEFLEAQVWDLQRWSGPIVLACPEEEDKVRKSIEGLIRAAVALSPEGVASDALAASIGKKRKQYAAWVMLKTVLLCDNVRDASKLRETILHAGGFCFPSLQSHLQDIVGELHVPSPSTISKQRYFVDVAFMRYMRKQHSDFYRSSQQHHSDHPLLCELLNVASFNYLMTDASPQGGQEWQLSQSLSVPILAVKEVGEACHHLICHSTENRIASKPDCPIENRRKLEMQMNTHMIQRHVKEHMFPVAGLGRASLALHHKVHALLHQIKLEVETSEELAEYLSSTVSITTDQGTEVGLGELPGLDLRQYKSSAENMEIEVSMDSNPCPSGPMNIEMEMEEVPARPGLSGSLSSYQRPEAEAAATLPRAGSTLPDGHYLWPFTLVVAGMCHICHNCCEELCVKLPCWDQLVEQVRPLASLLHSRSCRQRIEEKLLRDNSVANSGFKKQLQHTFHALYTSRWGSMTKVLEEILSVRTLLTSCWDPKKYAEGSSESDTQKIQLQTMTEAINSPVFWGHCHLILYLENAMDHFSNWCEGCPCHSLPDEDQRWKRQRQYMRDTGQENVKTLISCPFKGCKAASLACGDHQNLLAKLLENNCLDMQQSLPVLLRPEERDLVMRSWTIGKGTLEQEISRKTSFWTTLPHKLVGLAHSDPTKAAAAADECIRQFDSSPVGAHHRLSKLFLLPESPLRAGVDALRCGAKLCELTSDFQLAVYRFVGISVVERSVESKHARAKTYINKARRFSGASISLNLRLPEITKRLAQEPQMFADLTNLLKFHEAHTQRDLMSLLQLMGLSHHPAVRDVPGAVRHKLAVLVTYHLDAASQLRLPEVYAQVIRLEGKEKQKRLQEARAAAQRCGHAAQPAGSKEEALRASLLRGHGQIIASSCSSSVMYSLPEKPGNDLALVPLDDCQGILQLDSSNQGRIPLQLALPQPEQTALDREMGLDIVVQEGVQRVVPGTVAWAAFSTTGNFFYHVVKANPSRSKILQVAPNVKQFTQGQQVVQVHWQLKNSEFWHTREEVLVSVDPVEADGSRVDASSFCMDVDRLDDDTLLSGWKCWDILPRHEFILLDTLDVSSLQNQDLSTVAPLDSAFESMQVVKGLVDAQAFHGSGNFYELGSRGSSALDDEQRIYLEDLESRGFVTCEDISEGMFWQFSLLGQQHVKACLVLKNCRSVAQARPLPDSKTDWSVLELVCGLESQGWIAVHESVKQSAQRTLNLQEVVHEKGAMDSKCFFFDKSISKKYLLALAHADELHKAGVLELRHGQAATYYSKFFNADGLPQKPSLHDADAGPNALAIEMEVDHPPVPPKGKRAKVSHVEALALPGPDLMSQIMGTSTSALAPARRRRQSPREASLGDVGAVDLELDLILDSEVETVQVHTPVLEDRRGPAVELQQNEIADSAPPNLAVGPSIPQDSVAEAPAADMPEPAASNFPSQAEAAGSSVPNAPASSRASGARKISADVLGFWFDDPVTKLSHKFTYKSNARSWQVRCSFHDPIVNEKGNKTYCTRTTPIRTGETEETVLKTLKEWISRAKEFADKKSHQSMPHRAVKKASGEPKPKAKRRKPEPKRRVKAKPALADESASDPQSDSSDSSSSSSESSSSDSTEDEAASDPDSSDSSS